MERGADLIAFTADLTKWGSEVSLMYVAHGRDAASPFAGTKVTSWSQNLCWNEEAHERGFDEVILLNQAGKTSHQDICDSLELFAKEVMPEFHARQPAQEQWKQDVLTRKIVLQDLDTEQYDLYSHQNEDIVRLTPEQLRQRMAEKEKLAAAAGQ